MALDLSPLAHLTTEQREQEVARFERLLVAFGHLPLFLGFVDNQTGQMRCAASTRVLEIMRRDEGAQEKIVDGFVKAMGRMVQDHGE